MLRILLWIIALVVLFFLVVSVITFLRAVMPGHHGGSFTPKQFGVSYEDVSLTPTDGVQLAGWFVPSAVETDKAVAIFHGYPFSKSDVVSSTLFLHDTRCQDKTWPV